MNFLSGSFKFFIRDLARNKVYSLINISGLAVSFLCAIFIFLYLRDELVFDRFHRDAGRIYRVIDGMRFDEGFLLSAITPNQWIEVIRTEIPEIENGTRLWLGSRFYPVVRNGEIAHKEFGAALADSLFFRVFDFPFIAGKPENALNSPDKIVISDKMAVKYFGSENVLGRSLNINRVKDYEISGIIRIPPNSSFQFDFVLLRDPDFGVGDWANGFLKVKPGADIPALEEKMAALIKSRYGAAPYADRQTLLPRLQPLTRIHLHSDLQYESSVNRTMTDIYLFAGIAVFMLLTGAINFINLATARSVERAKEIGVRKTLGAGRGKLMLQFLAEGLVVAATAFLLALALAFWLMPYFNTLAGKEFEGHHLLRPGIFAALAGIALSAGLLSGVYPAFYLSAIRPVNTLKGIHSRNPKGSSGLRVGLVVVQFVISATMIVGNLVIFQQLNFLRNKELGFRKDQVVVVPIQSREIKQKHGTLRAELKRNPRILDVTFSQSLPGQADKMATLVYAIEGVEAPMIVPTFLCDPDFLKTLKAEMALGRDFRSGPTADSSAFIINEAAMKAFGWTGVENKRLKSVDIGWEGEVIGVVRDFHFASLHHSIQPLVIHQVAPSVFNQMAIRVKTGNLENTLAHIAEQWNKTGVGEPFEYSFLDEDFARIYAGEEKLYRIFIGFTVVAILIACLGLFSLAAFTLSRREKELSIRKVYGATEGALARFLLRDFLKYMLVAFVLSIPLSMYLTRIWLAHFAYHIEVGYLVYIPTGLFLVGFTLLAVGWQILRVVKINPAWLLKA